jgi:hypothetical protein
MTIATSARTLLRAVIVGVAALALWHFSDFYGKAFVTLTGGEAQWMLNRWEAFASGVAAPLCALAAAAFAIAGRRLGLACLLLGAALLLYVSFIIPFVLGVVIHGV